MTPRQRGVGRVTERERETETETETETDRHRHRDTYTETQTQRHRHRDTDRQRVLKSSSHVQTTVTPSAKKDVVQGLAALAEFRGWLRRHGYYRYDHALLLTG